MGKGYKAGKAVGIFYGVSCYSYSIAPVLLENMNRFSKLKTIGLY